jgi:hypothetical protein
MFGSGNRRIFLISVVPIAEKRSNFGKMILPGNARDVNSK